MSLVDRTGLARELIAPALPHTTVADARVQLLRLAAHSMLQDDPEHAPYGWTHCLTMPQATLDVGAPTPRPGALDRGRRHLRLRIPRHAEHDGDRSDLGTRARRSRSGTRERHSGRRRPVCCGTQRPDDARLVQELIDFAGAAEDAHLVKYTEACLTAARDDPDAARLFHAAMAYLGHLVDSIGALTQPMIDRMVVVTSVEAARQFQAW